MDEIVRQAMAKWPNVPHCYGWLALDARGAWRMRDERAQQLQLAGDKITQSALCGFINRNYGADARGCWYFQNGPQRVYVSLEATPHIVRSDPQAGWLLHTGQPLGRPEALYLTEQGNVLLKAGGRVAQLDDRDVAELLARLHVDGAPAGDDAVLAWLEGDERIALQLPQEGGALAVQRLASDAIADYFGFVRQPYKV